MQCDSGGLSDAPEHACSDDYVWVCFGDADYLDSKLYYEAVCVRHYFEYYRTETDILGVV